MEGGQENNQQYLCGGTIINERTIVTAATCVNNVRGIIPANRITTVAGTNNLNEYPVEAKIFVAQQIMVHQNFNSEFNENDIAFLKLGQTIEFSNYIQPICLSNRIDHSNITMGTVTGWGHDTSNQFTNVLQQAVLPIRTANDCRDSNRHFFPHYLNDKNYCAGYEKGTNVCLGDCGGAMIFKYKTRWYIRGIISFGASMPNSNRCDIMQMVLFTDVPKFYNWILNNLDNTTLNSNNK